MNSANGRARPNATLDASFSFSVTASKQTRIRQAAHFGDAVTVAGPKGPEVISKLRASGFDRPVLFDGMGYAGKEHVPATWVAFAASGRRRPYPATRRLHPVGQARHHRCRTRQRTAEVIAGERPSPAVEHMPGPGFLPGAAIGREERQST